MDRSAVVTPTAPEAAAIETAGGVAERPDEQLQSATSDAAMFTGAVYAAQALLFVGHLVQRGILGPAASGYWALMQALWGFFTIVSLGSFQGTTRQVPFHRGRGDFAAAGAVANTGNSFALAAISVLGVVVAAVALVFGGGWADEVRYGLVLLGLTAPLQFLSDCHETLLSATKRFGVVSRATVLKAVIALTLQTLFVVLFGFYGMFIGLIAASGGSLIYFARMGLTGFKRPAFSFTIDRARLGELIAFGFPIMLVGQMWVLFLALGTLIVAAFVEAQELGWFALGVSVSSYLLYLPKSIGGALMPRMAEQFGRDQDMAALRRYVTDVQHMLGFMLVPALIGAVYLLFPVLVTYALPEFVPSIPVIQIMALASFFVALCHMPVKILLTVGRRAALVVMVGLGLVVNAVGTYLAIGPLDLGIDGAAYATGISYLFVFLLTTAYSLGHMVGARQTAVHIAELFASFGYLAVALLGIDRLIGPGPDGLIPAALTGAGKLALLLVLLTPAFALVERRHGGVTQLWSLGRGAVRGLRAPPAATGRTGGSG